MKLKRIVAVSSLFFALGVYFHTAGAITALCLAALVFVVLISLKKGAAAALVVALAFLAGFFHTNAVYLNNYRKTSYFLAKSQFKCRVVSLESRGSYNRRVTASADGVRILLTYNGRSFSYGDVIFVTAEPKRVTDKLSLAGDTYLTADVTSSVHLGREINYFNPKDLAMLMRERLLSEADGLWHGEALMFARSVLFGATDYSSAEFKNKLALGSISHIIAISGLHVSLFSGAVMLIINKITARRYARLLCIPFTLFFMLFTGASPSCIRAAIMFSVYVISEECFAYYDGYTSMGIASTVILLANPFCAYSLSFILSFAAVLGILMFSGPIEARLSRLSAPVKSAFSTTLSAQAFTFPVSAIKFSRVPVFALAANLFAVPLLPIIMISGYAAVMLSFFSLDHPFRILCEILINFVIKTAETAAAWPLSNIPLFVKSIPLFLIFYTFSLATVYLFLKTRRRKAAYLIFNLSMLSLVVMLIASSYTPDCFVRKKHAVLIVHNESSVLFTDKYAYGLDEFLLKNKVSCLDVVAYTDANCKSPVSDIPVRQTLTHSTGPSSVNAAFLSDGDCLVTSSLRITAVKIPKKNKLGYIVEFPDNDKPSVFIYSDSREISILSEEQTIK